MVYKDKIAFLDSHISYMEINEIVIKYKWTCEVFKILILPIIYKDKMVFLCSYISYMENNVNEKR